MKYSLFVDAEGLLASDILFLSKAVSTDITRFMMQYIRVEPSEAPDDKKERDYPRLRAVATDGKRLHMVDPINDSAGAIHGMTPGLYRVLKANSRSSWLSKVSEEVPMQEYPPYRKVFPEGPAIAHARFSGFSKDHPTSSVELLKLFREFPEPTAANLNYIADLGMGRMWDVEWYGPRKALVFKRDERTAMIMPMEAV